MSRKRKVKAIQDNDRLYNFLSPLVQFGTRCHYEHFDVHGLENLPKEGSYIIAPCHQQALMEPLAVLNFAPKAPVFLARADIFKKPTIRAILTFLKILPVYRIRDGKESLSKNAEIFDKSRDVLLDGFPLCLMAEGRHNNRHQLLPLVKGMFRIAGETQQRLGDHPLYIVPTGIDFEDYEEPYSNLVVNIGKPIPVQPFMETFRDNEPVALNQMRDTLAVALRQQMHDIRSQEHYDDIMTLCQVLTPALLYQRQQDNLPWHRFRLRQEISRKADAMEAAGDKRFERLCMQAQHYRTLCRDLHMKPQRMAERHSLAITLCALLVVLLFLAGAIAYAPVRWCLLFALLCYPLPLLPTHLIFRKAIADTQFRSSVNFGVRFLLAILYTIVIAIVAACTGGLWMSNLADIGAWWGLAAVGLAHLGALTSGSLVNGFKKLFRNLYYWYLRLFRRTDMDRVAALEKAMQDTFTDAN